MSNSTVNRYASNEKIAMCAIYNVLFVLIIFSCATVIVTIVTQPILRKAFNYYVLSLCFSDILASSVIVPINTLILLEKLSKTHLCLISQLSFLLEVALFNSIYSVVAIAMDRHRAIVRPLNLRQGRPFLCVFFIWCSGLLYVLPRFVVVRKMSSCKLDDREELVFNVMDLIVAYIVPVMIVTDLYRRAIKVLKESQDTTPNMIAHRRKRRAIRMIVVISSIFAVCWLPYHLLGLFNRDIFSNTAAVRKFRRVLRYVSTTLILLSGWINVIIYGYFNECFRKTFHLLLRKVFNCSLRSKKNVTAAFVSQQNTSSNE
ncbi:QRFP-like peptide receptor [Centruroides vittatus]|uniref:QRFP-like peptide receptor n=1 Tax=Centruroides vittatus TaxID=120091 RepID=UPI00350EDC76